MMSSRLLKSGLCAILFALAVPMLAQDFPVISADNANALARTIPSEAFSEGSIGLRAIPNSTRFVYKNFSSYDEEAERALYDAAEGAPGPVFPEYPPHYTIVDYTETPTYGYGLDGYWTLSPDGRLWAAYYRNGEDPAGPTDLQLIDVATEEVVFTLFTDYISTSIQSPARVSFSPGSKFVVVKDSDVSIWSTSTGQAMTVESGSAKLAFSADDTRLVTASTASGDLTIQVRDTDTGEIIHTIQDPGFGALDSIEVSPDGNLLLMRGTETISVWTVETEEKLPLPEAPGILLSPSGTRVVLVSVGGTDKTLTFWDVATQTEVAALTLPAEGAYFSNRDGTLNVYASDGVNAVVINRETGEQLSELKTRSVDHAIFSPDGHLVVTWTGRMFNVWSADTGEALGEFEMDNPDDVPDTTVEIDNMTFSDDGKAILILPTFGTVEFWTVGE